MDIRQLQYYKEIVNQGSISKAAEILNIAQPPLSQTLKKLETELGTTLIHRYRQKWQLTETGELLYQYAKQLLGQMEEVERRIQEIEEGTSGTLRIGVSSACSNMIVDYIVDFRAKCPQIRTKIYSGDSEGLLKKLNQKELDLAFIIRPSNTEQFEYKTLKNQPAVLIVPNDLTNSLSSKPTLEEIAQFPFIMLGAMEGHSFYENILKSFDEYNLKPNIIVECKDIQMVIALVNRGIGISNIPKMDYRSLYFEHFKIYELQQFNICVEPVLMKLKDVQTPIAATRFWDLLH